MGFSLNCFHFSNDFFLFLGGRSVGKTTVISRYCDNQFVEKTQTYLDFGVRKMKVDNQIVRIQLWDSSQHMDNNRSHSFSYRFYRSANAIIFVYDLSNRESFTCIRDMYTITSRFCYPGLPIILLGNKLDLRISKISKSEIHEFMDGLQNISLAEVSSLTNINLQNTLNVFVQRIIRDGIKPETNKTLQPKKEHEKVSLVRKLLCSCCT